MKRKQALAILLSAVLSFTSCTPLGMMTVSASENDESVVIEAEQDGGQEIVSGDEADTAVGEDFSVQETASDAGTFVVSDPIDATVDPEQGDIGQESSDETVIEGGDEAGDASADENEGLSSVPEIVPDGTEAGAGDETAVIPAEQDVFSDDTGVSTDAGDTAAETIDVPGEITGDTDNSAAAGDVSADITDMPGDLSDDADNSTGEGDEAADQSNNFSENAAGAIDSAEAVFDDSSITPDAEDPSAGLPAAAEPETGAEEPSSIEQPGETESVSESAQKGLSTPTPEDLENAVDIYAGDVADVSIPEENGHVFFRVNIEETGFYALYSSDNDDDPYAGLYDAEGNELSTSDDSDDSNFRFEQSFDAGTVYYLQACAFGSGTGNYKVHFEKNDSYFFVNRVGDEERWVAYGDEATLEISAESSSPISCQWYSTDGSAIEGAQSETYTFTADRAGEYYCLVTNEEGEEQSVYFYIRIENNLQISSEYGNSDVYVSFEDSVTLNPVVTADNTDGLTYSWYRYVYDEENGYYSRKEVVGATSESYTVDSVSGFEQYEVVVEDLYGNTATLTYCLYINNHLSISGESEIYVSPGESVTLNPIVTADDTSSLTYVWEHRVYHEEYEGYVWEKMEGVTSDFCTIDSVSGYDEYQFSVSDQYGNNESICYTIYVLNNLEVSAENGDTGSTSLIVSPGTSLELKPVVTAEDTSGLTYTWYHRVYDEENGGNNWETMEGVTSDSYTIDSVSGKDQYEVYVYDQYGNSGSLLFYIYVQNNLQVSADNGDTYETTLYVSPGTSLELKPVVTADDLSGLTYEWYRGVYNEEYNYYDWEEMEGVTSDSYTIDSVSTKDAFEVKVSDQYGNSDSLYYYIQVQNNLKVNAENGDTFDTSLYVLPGVSVELKPVVTADDTSGLTYTWYHCDYSEEVQECFSEEKIEGATTDSYTIDSVSGNGDYKVIVSDQYGNRGCLYYQIYVQNNLKVSAENGDTYETTLYVSPGTPLELKPVVTADDASGLTYTWYHYAYVEEYEGYNWEKMEGVTSDSYTTDSIAGFNGYRIEVSDQYGNSDSLRYYIYVQNNLKVSAENGDTYETSLYVSPGTPLELKPVVTADDASSLTYSWYHRIYNEEYEYYSSEKMEGVTTNSYTIDSVSTKDAYEVIVSDQYGNSDSLYYYIYVQNNLDVSSEDGYKSVKSLHVSPGTSLELKPVVTADDTSSLTYAWYHCNYDDEVQESFNEEKIEGATTDSYTIDSVSINGDYKVIVSDQYGNSDFLYYCIQVQNNLKVSAENGDTDETYLYVSPGTSFELKPVVTADDASGLTYTWYHYVYEEEYDGYNWEEMEGVTSDSYTIDSVSGYDEYKVIVSDQYGNSGSLYYYIYVQNNLEVSAENGDTYETYLYVSPGASAELKPVVTADDTSSLTYTWYHRVYDEEYYDYSWEEMEGVTSDSYTIDSVSVSERYEVRVSDQYGNSDYLYYYIYVQNNLKVSAENGDTFEAYLHVSPGTTLELKPVVTADDASGLTYSWYHRVYDEENENYTMEKMEGVTSDSYTIDSVSGYDEYQVEVSDQYGNNDSLYYYIYVENHLEVVSENGDSYSTDMHVSPHASATLKPVVTADDQSGLTYEWNHRVYDEDNDDYNWEKMEGVISDSYTIDSVSRNDQYEVIVSDQYGNNANLYYNIYVENNLEVYPDVDGRDEVTAYYYVTPGSSLELKGAVKAEDDSGISCSWYKYDQQNDYDYSEIEGADSLSYTITASSEYCRYQLLVKDQFGNEARAYFHVYASENYLAAYPAERSPEYNYSYLYITPGQPAEMKVIVQSDHPDSLTRQWFRYNETDDEYILIEGADSDTYMIDAVTKAETFKYTITDGNDLSSSVYFYVIADNDLSAKSEGPDGDYTSNHYYVAPGGSVDLKASVSAIDESNLTFQWSVEEKTEDGDFIDIPGANSLFYTVENVNKRSCYRFRVSDQYGNSDTLYYYIFAKTDLEVEAEGDTVYDVAKGADLQLKANVSVMPGIDLSYSWHDDVADEELPFDASSPTVYTVSNIRGYKKITFTACDPYENSKSVTFRLYVTGQPAVYPEGESMGITSYTRYYDSGDCAVYVTSDRDDQQLLYAWYDEDTGELLQKGDSNSYGFTMVNKNLNFRCHVSEIGHEDNYIDLYYHVLSKVPSAEEFAAAQTLGDHDGRAVSLSKDNVWDVFKFIPSETADYYFSSRSTDGDPYGVLFDDSFNIISEDDDGMVDRDFYLESTLEKGKTYYIMARAYTIGNPALYTLYSRRVGEEITTLREQPLSAENLSVVYGSSAMIQVNGAYGDLSFSSSNGEAVSVDTTGKVTAKGVGTSDITISAGGTAEYLPADPITIRVTVTPATITSDDVTLDSAALTYDGKAKTPSVTVTTGSTVLVPETDYTVSYSENVNAGTDTASVTVKGCGNYTGEVTKTFSIAKAKQSITGVSNTYSKTFGNSAFSLGAKAKTKLTYKSSNTGACLVDAAGKVTIKGAGTAKITITAAAGTNYNKAVKTVTVEVAKAKQSITGVSTVYNKTYGNAAFSLGAKAKTKLTYKSSDTKIVAVSTDGKVTIKRPGTAKITITAAAGTNYNKAVKTVTVKVAKAKQSITGVKTKINKTYGNKAFSLGAKAKTKRTYNSSNTRVAVVSTGGKVTIKGAGTTKITITAIANTYYNEAVKTITLSVAKAAPAIKIKTASKSFTEAAVKKAAQSFSPGITVNSQGKLSYKKSSGTSSITVSRTTGKITVKKGTKKGTYKIKIAATAAARGNYKKGTKTFTVTVTVK